MNVEKLFLEKKLNCEWFGKTGANGGADRLRLIDLIEASVVSQINHTVLVCEQKECKLT